ncbi:chorismate synthase [Tissierella creatinophila]|uniref:Chorismate synthase n=1 Tax=Tissierella creatinophila DSM 6911 TaxID=1123403 RepID=A0A1U7M518_TISCR|nr:chorismate synthase [Tissierella creatinophila]OLS02350.1 chorismate synthase [Tissierella creatinophila DSM 6911]
MSSTWGNNIKLSLFGESHGGAIGINIDGLPSGISLNLEEIKIEMKRRAPGQDKTATSRKEKDEFEILSGYFNDKTTGTPLSIMIRNTNTQSKDYDKTKDFARPGHADFTGRKRYLGNNDYRGGGHFSGRLTAPIVFAGAIAKQILSSEGVIVGSHIKSIGEIEDNSFDPTKVSPRLLEFLKVKKLPTIDDNKSVEMEKTILRAKEEGDSVGGVIELAVINPMAGLGSPFFDSVESHLSHMIFSIPGVKGIEFGKGFDITKMRGSKANDEMYMEGEEVKTYTNNNGGILGGISSGMPIIFRVALKPTASIAKSQRTIDMFKNKDAKIEIVGRHDPCIVVRAVPVLEAATAIVILDLLMEMKKYDGFKRA